MAQKTVTGTVTDNTGAPLPGVTVFVKGTAIGSITNIDGVYSLSVPNDAKSLMFSFIGMKTQEIAIGTQSSINVKLEPDVIGLEEVVAIGYGTVKKKDLTGAVSQINAEKLEKEATSNITSLLRGAMPGMNVNMSSSAKGLSGAEEMLIRGQTSLRANDSDGDLKERKANAPLIVLDGMIYYGDLSEINPSDIETFDVLKDASSAAIYGSRAANGVVLITTKKGKKGKPIISFSANVGVATPSNVSLELLNKDQFIAWRQAGFERKERHQIDKGPGYYNKYDNLPEGVTLDQWKAYSGSSAATDLDGVWLTRLGFSPIEVTNYKNGTTRDWTNDILQNGLQQDYNAAISGASEATNYYFSLGYTDNEGIIYNERFKVLRARINLEVKVTDWLKVGTNTQFAIRDQSQQNVDLNSYGGSWGGVNPFASYYEADGTTITFAPTGNTSASRHPHRYIVYRDNFAKYNSLNSKLYATITLPYGFSITSDFITRFNWNRNYWHNSSADFEWAAIGGEARRDNTTINEWQMNNMLKWNKEYGDHSFDFTFVQTAEKYQYWWDRNQRRKFLPNDILGYHRMQAASEDVDLSSNDEVSTGNSLLGRLNYVYKGKYLVTASLRRDGYSAFGQSNPYADFGAIALGWTISEESFFNTEMLDLLKLRASYGTNGNRGVGIYDALSNLSTGKYLFTNNTSGSEYYVSQLYADRMENKNLKWERTSAYNFGLDFSTLNGRLRGNIDGYHMITKDLIMPRQLPNVTGYKSVYDNLGQVNNTGIEIALNSTNIQKKDLTWTTGFSLSHNKNEIKHLFYDYVEDENGNLVEVDDISNGWFIGEDINAVWDYELNGIWQAEEADAAKVYSRFPGDWKQVDQEIDGVKDGLYTNADKKILGSTQPKVRLTFRSDLTWKDFEFGVKMYSYLGMLQQNNHRKSSDVFYDRGAQLNVPYWTPENRNNEWAGIESYATGFNVWDKSSFLRIDNISLSYNIPQNYLQKAKIVNAKISLIAQNPFVIAPNWGWMDPEIQNFAPSNYSIKLNLTL
ncbi:TonB-dependent receptor [Draconibacterium sp.]|jgi:TonB-linked SusC/RagA family outer membrane protein